MAISNIPLEDIDDLKIINRALGHKPKYTHKFIIAASYGDIKSMEKELNDHVDINVTDEFGNPALFYTSTYGLQEATDWLLNHNANMYIHSHYGRPGFHEACEHGHYGIVCSYIAAGYDPNTPDICNTRGIMLAARNGHSNIVKILLLNGSHVDLWDVRGRTAIMYCSEAEHCDIKGVMESAQALLDANADINLQDNEGNSVLHISAAKGLHPELVKFFINNNADPFIQNALGEIPASCLDRYGKYYDDIKNVIYDAAIELHLNNMNIKGGKYKHIANSKQSINQYVFSGYAAR